MNRLTAYLRLARFPAVFTAVADVVLGYLSQHQTVDRLSELGLLLLASACLYTFGMILNDVWDRRRDAVERPERPIPSGAVSVRNAVVAACLLAFGGLAAARAVGWASAVLGGTLIVAILAYDGLLKQTPAGPLAMGLCRFLNVLLGASAVAELSAVGTLPQLPIAAGIGVYVTGLTWFARREAAAQAGENRIAPAIVINFGLAMLAAFVMHWRGMHPGRVLILLGVVALTVNIRLTAAILAPSPQRVQHAVRTLLLSIIVIDATLVLFLTGSISYAAIVVVLVIPALVLERWMAMT